MRKLLLLLAACPSPRSPPSAAATTRLRPAPRSSHRPAPCSTARSRSSRRATRRRRWTRSSPSSLAAGRRAKLKDLIDKALRESDSGISLQGRHRAVARRRGGVLRRAGRNMDQSALLIATDDEDTAREALEKSAEGKVTRKSYKDVEYLTDESGESNTGAVFDGFLVVGTEAGVKAAIDTSKGDSTLSDDDDYKGAIDDAADDRLGLFYVNSPELLKDNARRRPRRVPEILQEGSSRSPRSPPSTRTTTGWSSRRRCRRGARTRSVPRSGQRADRPSCRPTRGSRWLSRTSTSCSTSTSTPSRASPAGAKRVEQQFKAATGLDLQTDVLDWMGDFGVFVRGTSVDELDGRAHHRDERRGRHPGASSPRSSGSRGAGRGPGDRVSPAGRSGRRRGLHAQ